MLRRTFGEGIEEPGAGFVEGTGTVCARGAGAGAEICLGLAEPCGDNNELISIFPKVLQNGRSALSSLEFPFPCGANSHSACASKPRLESLQFQRAHDMSGEDVIRDASGATASPGAVCMNAKSSNFSLIEAASWLKFSTGCANQRTSGREGLLCQDNNSGKYSQARWASEETSKARILSENLYLRY